MKTSPRHRTIGLAGLAMAIATAAIVARLVESALVVLAERLFSSIGSGAGD